MLHQLISRGTSLYPRIYMQFAALVALLIAAEFSVGTLSLLLTQRVVFRASQRVRMLRQRHRDRHDHHVGDNCCA